MPKKILIADDSKVFRQLQAQLLERQGYQLFHAEDGAQATKLAFEQVPDLILLDVQMPLMDGVQVLATLKNNPATKHIPVVMVTTIGKETDKRILQAGGADEVLSKPIDRTRLLAVVGRLLGEK